MQATNEAEFCYATLFLPKLNEIGQFPMVSQPIGLILVDWFIFIFLVRSSFPPLFFKGRLPFKVIYF
jgi:hypothetical protein